MKKMMPIVAIACLGLVSWVIAGEHDHMAPNTPMSKEFQQMKQLVGNWKGTAIEGAMDKQDIQVEYSLTAGGTAIAEKLTPGTPHEMLSVYTDEGGKLGMTHYCLMGNHPNMQLTKADVGELDFEMKKPGAINAKDPHMHALTIYFQDPDHIMQKWTSYADGKEKSTTTFKLARVK